MKCSSYILYFTVAQPLPIGQISGLQKEVFQAPVCWNEAPLAISPLAVEAVGEWALYANTGQ